MVRAPDSIKKRVVLWLEHLTLDQEDGGSILPAAVSKLGRQFFFIPFCLCLSEETVKSVGPFFLGK